MLGGGEAVESRLRAVVSGRGHLVGDPKLGSSAIQIRISSPVAIARGMWPFHDERRGALPAAQEQNSLGLGGPWSQGLAGAAKAQMPHTTPSYYLESCFAHLGYT